MARFGGRAVTTDDAELIAEIAVAHMEPNRADNWIALWCPGLAPDADVAIRKDAARTRKWTAAALGKALALTWAERRALRIRTIRASDIALAEARQRASEIKRENDRLRDESSRRAAGVSPRRKGDSASTEAVKLGVSRSTYLRRKGRERANDTRNSAHNYRNYMREFQVSAQIAPWQINALRAAGLVNRIVPSVRFPDLARLAKSVAVHAAAAALAGSAAAPLDTS